MVDNIKQKVKLAWDRKLSYLNLQEKFQEELTFAHSGGMWRADRETIGFLSAFENIKQMTVEDIYQVPRQVNPGELLEVCKQKYQFAANNWATEYARLSTVRNSNNV